MVDFSKPVQTRSGREVVVLSTAGRGDYPIVGQVRRGFDGEIADSWTEESWNPWGRWLGGEKSALDLVNVPDTQMELWNARGPWINSVFSREELENDGSIEPIPEGAEYYAPTAGTFYRVKK